MEINHQDSMSCLYFFPFFLGQLSSDLISCWRNAIHFHKEVPTCLWNPVLEYQRSLVSTLQAAGCGQGTPRGRVGKQHETLWS